MGLGKLSLIIILLRKNMKAKKVYRRKRKQYSPFLSREQAIVVVRDLYLTTVPDI